MTRIKSNEALRTKILKCGDRRISLMFYLSRVRTATYEDIMEKYGVSHGTVFNDLEFLSEEMGVPLNRGKGLGRISIVGNWSAYIKHLNDRQQSAIVWIIKNCSLPESIRKVLFSILTDHGFVKEQ